MIFKKYSHLVFILVILSGGGCEYQGEQQSSTIPEQISNIENLTVYPPDIQPPDTVELVKETVFESNNEVFMEGYISGLAVDDQDRVFISATRPGSVGIYVFNPDGEYISRFSNHGKGPGEYESIRSIVVSNHQLYLFDPRLQKFGIFSLDDFSHIKDEVIKRGEIATEDSIDARMRGDQLFVTGDDDLYIRLHMIPQNKETDIPKKIYYRLAPDGTILPGSVLEVKRFQYFFPTHPLDVPFPMPFTRSSLVSIADDGRFYTAWTEDFLIRVYDKEGNYERTFYYPIEKSPFILHELDLSRERIRDLEAHELPETWPALHTMELDDEGRLWVATITGSDSTFQWRVLNRQGELLARFTHLGAPASRVVIIKPFILIKNGFFYTHEQNIQAGIDRIVKYRIIFKES